MVPTLVSYMAKGCCLLLVAGRTGGLSRLELGFPVLGVDLSLTPGGGWADGPSRHFSWLCARALAAWSDTELFHGPARYRRQPWEREKQRAPLSGSRSRHALFLIRALPPRGYYREAEQE